jgi:carboxyl-terminal processing protease
VFRNFVLPGMAALDEAFAEFARPACTQLIVDLRYNGGGLVSVLEHFASLLGSRIAPGQVFASYRYNDKNSARNETFCFADPPPEGRAGSSSGSCSSPRPPRRRRPRCWSTACRPT